MRVLRRLVREPLLHFLALGALLFAAYGWMNGGRPADGDARDIVVSRGQVASLKAQFEGVWQRQPDARELQQVIDGWVREEVLYREGLAMGLERDDLVVRRRVVQKIEFIADSERPEGPDGAAAATDAELQAWLAQHPGDYRVEPVYSLQQLYFDPARRGDRLDADIAAARRSLLEGRKATGDATMLPPSMQQVPASEVGRVFGDAFAQALATLPVGSWSEPVRSGLGLHLVRLGAREDGGPATLAQARPAIERDWLRARAASAREAIYAKARERYTVRVEGSDAP